jgi:hypothetical protein
MKPTWNTHSVDQFVKLVSQARSHNSKEVRMSIADAQALCDSMCVLLLQERELTQQLLRAQERVIQSSTVTPQIVNLNGGSFS